MAFLGFFRKKKLPEAHILALDIGTSVIKALIFKISEEGRFDKLTTGRGMVIGVGRESQEEAHMLSGVVTDINGVVSTCEKAIRKAEEMAGVKADRVILGIAGELVKGTTTTVHYERLAPEIRIDMSELKNIISKVQWKSFDRARKELAFETGQSEIDVKLINAAIVDVRIDGMRILNPLGFQGKDVSIGVFNAYAPLVHLGALETIAALLGLEVISITAEPYAVARSLGGSENENFGAIFIDVGGGTTDIAVVRAGGVEGAKMFALGGKAFTKRLSHEFGIEFDKAEEIKIRYSKNELSKEVSQKIRKIFKKDIDVWLSGVTLALEEFKNIDLLPSEILLCGGGSSLGGIEKALRQTKWYSRLPFAKTPRVNFLEPKDIFNVIDKTGKLKTHHDITPMALASLAVSILQEESVLSKILRKAVRLIQT